MFQVCTRTSLLKIKAAVLVLCHLTNAYPYDVFCMPYLALGAVLMVDYSHYQLHLIYLIPPIILPFMSTRLASQFLHQFTVHCAL